MKDKYGDLARLDHILDSIKNINSFLKENIILEDLKSVRMLSSAILYEFVIIGEASKHVSDETKALFPEAKWTLAYQTRNKLVHEYADVALGIMLKIIRVDLPIFENYVKQALEVVGKKLK
ncbi:MAG: DUF86 domain-containing protein [Bacteroidetes bacterium]|nr:MAG: DUF86 domain-containing protein [Bacteroidota bacterium]